MSVDEDTVLAPLSVRLVLVSISVRIEFRYQYRRDYQNVLGTELFTIEGLAALDGCLSV